MKIDIRESHAKGEFFYIIPTWSRWGNKSSINYPTEEAARNAALKHEMEWLADHVSVKGP